MVKKIVEFSKAGNFRQNETNKYSLLQFQSDLISNYADDELKASYIQPHFNKSLYLNKNNNMPPKIISSFYDYEKRILPQRIQPADINDDDDGRNIPFINAYYADKKISGFEIAPEDINHYPSSKTKINDVMKLKKNYSMVVG